MALSTAAKIGLALAGVGLVAVALGDSESNEGEGSAAPPLPAWTRAPPVPTPDPAPGGGASDYLIFRAAKRTPENDPRSIGTAWGSFYTVALPSWAGRVQLTVWLRCEVQSTSEQRYALGVACASWPFTGNLAPGAIIPMDGRRVIPNCSSQPAPNAGKPWEIVWIEVRARIGVDGRTVIVEMRNAPQIQHWLELQTYSKAVRIVALPSK